MSDGHLIVLLSTTVEDEEVVIGAFGPYGGEDEASEHVEILRDPEMLKRLRHGQQISIGQYRLEDPLGVRGAGGGTAGRVATEPLDLGFGQAQRRWPGRASSPSIQLVRYYRYSVVAK
jgi:hypothetical protein